MLPSIGHAPFGPRALALTGQNGLTTFPFAMLRILLVGYARDATQSAQAATALCSPGLVAMLVPAAGSPAPLTAIGVAFGMLIVAGVFVLILVR